MKILRMEKTQTARWEPERGKRISITNIHIANPHQERFCVTIQLGATTRFVAYLGHLHWPLKKLNIRFPRPLTGRVDESLIISASDPLPVVITLAGYES